MFENENNLFGGENLDLGNDMGAGFEDFTPFDSGEAESIFAQAPVQEPTNKEENPVSDVPAAVNTTTEVVAENKDAGTEVKKDEQVTTAADEVVKTADVVSAPKESQNQANYFDAVIADAENKEAENAKSVLMSKLPIFSHGSAKEEIVDTSKTFDDLRKEKAEDFPELDDYSVVTWTVTYGTISKTVSTPKKTTIASFKKEIENSKEFTTMLTKAQNKTADKKGSAKEDKPIECVISPKTKMKPKGVVDGGYKGVFTSFADAQTSGKVIAFVPSDDGNVYEIRSEKMGTFIAKAENVTMLDKVRAGFIPALPKIPYEILSEIISFFKSYITESKEFEALAYIFWSFEDEEYFVYIPKQKVSKARVIPECSIADDEKNLLVMQIHSHNTMPAFFSRDDDAGEQATKLYSVVGRLDKVFPNIKTRISVGGKFVEINPSTVFDGFEGMFPEEWQESVELDSRFVKEAGL